VSDLLPETRKPTITSIEALDNDREKDKRRAQNLLSIFETDKARHSYKTFFFCVAHDQILFTTVIHSTPL
jgi:hypothetical protein